MSTTCLVLEIKPIIKSNDKRRIIFLGTPIIAIPTLKALINSDLKPIAVITEPDKSVGRKQILTPPPVKLAAEENNISVYQPKSAEELKFVVQMLNPTLGIIVAYGRILKPDILAIPEFGFVNLHFSLLPKYRGATPIQAAILNGDEITGATLMQIDEGLDTGPIIGWIQEPIRSDDTTQSLSNHLADSAAALAIELIPKFLFDEITTQPQFKSPDPVTKRLTKEDGRINWDWPADKIEKFIRAMNHWPLAWTEIDDLRIIIHSAHIKNNRLTIDKIQTAGGKIITGSEFARGYKDALTELVNTGKVNSII